MTIRIKKTIALIGIVLSIALFAGSLPVLAEIVQGTHIYLPIVLKAESTPEPGDLDNPGFEEGQTGWTFYHNYGLDIVINYRAHSGQNSARLGSDLLNNMESYISQQVEVPFGKPYLTFWSYTYSQEGYCPQFTPYDYFIVKVNGQPYPDENSWIPLCEEQNGYWIKRSVDLSVFQGTTPSVKIYFQSDSTLETDFFVDDFTFEYP